MYFHVKQVVCIHINFYLEFWVYQKSKYKYIPWQLPSHMAARFCAVSALISKIHRSSDAVALQDLIIVNKNALLTKHRNSKWHAHTISLSWSGFICNFCQTVKCLLYQVDRSVCRKISLNILWVEANARIQVVCLRYQNNFFGESKKSYYLLAMTVISCHEVDPEAFNLSAAELSQVQQELAQNVTL